MQTSELHIPGIDRSGLLRLPDSAGAKPKSGVVALHGSDSPGRQQPLFDHLSTTLTSLGYAVLSYDRRPAPDGYDVPFEDQADDALAAVAALRARIGAPVGLYGFSQGTWPAAMAATRSDDVAFLALIGCSGVSPAAQMRYFTDESLRRNGFGEADRARLADLRAAFEDALRGDTDAFATVARALPAASAEPWFTLAYLPSELPSELRSGTATWDDMDFDPELIYQKVTCPVLLMYGEDEENVPAGLSADIWRRAASVAGNADLTIAEVSGCGHFPATPGAAHERENISSAYTGILIDWFTR